MRDGNPEIYVMAAGGPPDANGQTLLTNNPADYYPNWGAPAAIVPPMPMTYTALVPVVMGE